MKPRINLWSFRNTTYECYKQLFSSVSKNNLWEIWHKCIYKPWGCCTVEHLKKGLSTLSCEKIDLSINHHWKQPALPFCSTCLSATDSYPDSDWQQESVMSQKSDHLQTLESYQQQLLQRNGKNEILKLLHFHSIHVLFHLTLFSMHFQKLP